MKKRKTPSRSPQKKTPSTRPSKTSKRLAERSRNKTKPAASTGEPEVRRAIPLDYVTTDAVDLRSAPDLAAPKLPGGLLGKDTLVRIAPQDWWYVEVERPTTATGVLRGWVSNALLRRATAAEEEAMSRAPGTPPPPSSRRDAQGHLRVYDLPAGDGGGRYEVAGINERYHPRETAKLRDLINARRYDEAEDYAAEVIAEYTDVVLKNGPPEDPRERFGDFLSFVKDKPGVAEVDRHIILYPVDFSKRACAERVID